MKLSVSSIFLKPDYSFDISHKVDKYIVKRINESILPKYGDQLDLPIDYYLGLVISTKAGILKLTLDRPTRSKKYKCVDHWLWIPYEAVAESVNYLKSYIEFLFEGINLLFTFYNIKISEEIEVLKMETIGNMINNPEYEINTDDDVLKMYNAKNKSK